jgi:hypothetical protein
VLRLLAGGAAASLLAACSSTTPPGVTPGAVSTPASGAAPASKPTSAAPAAYPILSSLYFSFTDYNGVSAPIFVGIDNYTQMFFEDPVFWHALANTLFFAVFALPAGIIVSFGLATLLNLPLRGVSVYGRCSTSHPSSRSSPRRWSGC